MINLQKILVATDFSEASNNALKYAKALTYEFDAELHVVHVIDDAFVYGTPGSGFVGTEENLYSSQRDYAVEELRKMFSEDERAKYKAKEVILKGRPFVQIIQYARENGIDLIVTGTHGRGAVSHILLGSVAERVVRKSPCPVLTVRHPEHEFVMP